MHNFGDEDTLREHLNFRASENAGDVVSIAEQLYYMVEATLMIIENNFDDGAYSKFNAIERLALELVKDKWEKIQDNVGAN